MDNNKIPIFNEKFELPIFFHILKKSRLIFVFLVLLVTTFTFLYLRYTKPVYQTSSIIQINTDNSPNNKFLQIDDIYENSNIDNIIELLKSKEFLKRVFNKLDLKVSYFNDGTFLSEELYTSSPFEFYVSVKNASIYDTPIYIKFVDADMYKLTINKKEYPDTYKVGKNYKLNQCRCLASKTRCN